MHEPWQSEIERLRARLRRTERLLAAGVLGFAAIALAAAVDEPGTVRAQALVITDAAGRDRILLGAPVPESAHRQRTDARTASLVFLDAEGHDRVVVGAAPAPYVGGRVHNRIGEAHGLTFYDPSGSERGGIAFLDNGRAVVALDYPERDAVGMMVDDRSGFAGMLVAHRTPTEHAAILIGAEGGVPRLSMHDAAGREQARLPEPGRR